MKWLSCCIFVVEQVHELWWLHPAKLLHYIVLFDYGEIVGRKVSDIDFSAGSKLL